MAAAIPVSSAPNVQPKRKDDGLPERLGDYLEHIRKQFDKALKPGRFLRYYVWSKAELYWRGDQLQYYNPYANRWEPMDDDETDLYFINNIFNPTIEQLASEYSKSKPKLVAYSEAGDDRHITGATEAAQFLINWLQDNLWQPDDLQREAKTVLLRGLVFTRTWRDPNAGPLIEVPVFEQLQAELGPEIAAELMKAVPQKQPAGRIRSDAIDPFEVEIWDRKYKAEESPYLEWNHLELKADVMGRYDLDELPAGADDYLTDGRSGLAFKRQLELAIGNTGEADATNEYGYGSYGYTSDGSGVTDEVSCLETQVYFDKKVYQNWVTRKNEPLPGTDQMIPRGTRLGEVFDKGLKISKANGKVVRVENHDKNDEWSSYQFQVPAAGMYGVGSENLMAIQDWFNEFGSFINTAALYSANGITVADTSRISNGEAINRPGTIVDGGDLLPGETLDNILKHYQTQGMDPVIMQLPEFLKESMQATSGARNSQVSGQPGAGMDTATGVINMQGNADSFAGMKTELRAANHARRMEQAVKLFQEGQAYPRYFGRFGATKGRWLRGMDIGAEIGVRFEPDSHHPRTNMDVRNDTAAAIGLGWRSGNLPPEVDRHVGNIFNMPSDLDRFDDWATRGQKRLDDAREAAAQAAEMMEARGVPESAAMVFVMEEALAAAAPDPLDDHAALAAFYRDYYLSDRYDEEEPIIKELLHLLVAAHEAGGVMEAQKQVAMATEAEAPAREAEASQGREDAEREEGRAMQEEERSERDAERQAAEAEAQREHERVMQERKLAHDEQMAERKTEEEK